MPFLDAFSLSFSLLASADASLVEIVWRSLSVSLSATAWAGLLGMIMGAWLGIRPMASWHWVLAVLNTLLALPSVLVGLLIYLLLSRSGPLGHWGWLYTFEAMVLAQTVLLLPLVTALTRQWVNQAHSEYGEQLMAWGAGSWMRCILLVWDLRWPLVTVWITAFGRAVSEVGAVMIVGGNVDGFTRVMTTAIALETSKGDLPLALGLGMVLLGVVLVLHVMLALLLRKVGSNRPAMPVGVSA